MVHFSSSSDHKKSASAALAQDDDYYYNDNYNDSSDDDNDTSGVDMTFSQLYEIMRTQQSVPANILLTLSKKDLVLCELKVSIIHCCVMVGNYVTNACVHV